MHVLCMYESTTKDVGFPRCAPNTAEWDKIQTGEVRLCMYTCCHAGDGMLFFQLVQKQPITHRQWPLESRPMLTEKAVVCSGRPLQTTNCFATERIPGMQRKPG